MSKWLIFYLICWFDIVRNICGCLTTSHAPIISSEKFEKRPKAHLIDFCLTSNTGDCQRPIYTSLIIFWVLDFVLDFDFDACYPSQTEVPLGDSRISGSKCTLCSSFVLAQILCLLNYHVHLVWTVLTCLWKYSYSVHRGVPQFYYIVKRPKFCHLELHWGCIWDRA